MNVGDYVRTNDGLIGKVVSEPYEYKDDIGCDIDFGDNNIYNEYEMYQSIIKSSPNIINLIEVGDYVNGQYVVEKFYDYANEEWNIVTAITQYLKIGKNRNDIKTIVTREMHSNVEYRVESN